MNLEPRYFKQVAEFCAEEVRRQRDEHKAVAWMLVAWEFALARQDDPLTVEHVRHLGGLVKPTMNAHGWRNHGIYIGSRRGPDATAIPRMMEAWGYALRYHDQMLTLARSALASQKTTGPTHPDGEAALDRGDFPAAAYLAFEDIHPFGDGNGRTGKIIYNWLRGTLEEPEFPPKFWPIVNY